MRFCKLFFLLICLAPLHGCDNCDSSQPVTLWVELFCLLNQSPGVFVDETATRLPAESNFAVRAAVGDVDGDNDLDLVVAPGGHTSSSPVPPQNFLLQINDGTGVFTNEAASRLPASAFGTQVAAAVILADVDGDTDLDAFVVNGSSAAVFSPGFSGFQNLLWINNGGGIFSDETNSRLPLATNSSFHAAFGDLDSDGDLDLVIGNLGSMGTGQQNRLLINNGFGVFTDETAIRLPALLDITFALALADLDGDFDLDIVVANRTPTGSKILINNGVGFFTDESVQRFSTPPPFAGDVVVTDVNGDGSKISFSPVSPVDLLCSSIPVAVISPRRRMRALRHSLTRTGSQWLMWTWTVTSISSFPSRAELTTRPRTASCLITALASSPMLAIPISRRLWESSGTPHLRT